MTPTEDASRKESEALVGRVLAANFRIERLIGTGAMGNVYQAEQLSLGKQVAVKVLHPHLMGDEKLVKRFQREAKSASRLNHPNSIQIIDSGQDEPTGALYIAMELLAGRDLAQVIRDEFPLPVPRIVRIMSQVFSALDEAHAAGVIHRDLKPSNIMLVERRGESDFVKVCDYGIAKAHFEDGDGDAQMLTMQGLVCGTPEYMSPEQARGEPLDGRTDLYSAAVILYHMVTGDIPFRATTPIGIVSRHLSEAPPLPSAKRPDPSIPADLDDLILRGLAKSRDQRPASAAAFRDQLEGIGGGRSGRRIRGDDMTVPATPATDAAAAPTTLLPVAMHPRRRPRRGRALALGLVITATAMAVAMVLVKRSRPPAAANVAVSTPAIAPSPAGLGPPPPGAAPAESPAPAAPPAMIELAASPAGPPKARPRPGDRHAGVEHRAAAPTAGPTTPQAAPAPAPTPPSAAEEQPGAPAPVTGPRDPKEMIADAERMLSHGDAREACARGEDVKKSAPRLATAYKFLGKCYMRAGDPGRAKENYRRYLELAPGAPDAMFIESIVK